jgi:ankyrin repeat protein
VIANEHIRLKHLPVIFATAVLVFGFHLSASANSAQKITYAADAFFTQGSSVVSVVDDKLEDLGCRALQTKIEVIIVVGHADRSESNAQKLSELRALKVKEKLLSLGLEDDRIFTEGKAASQPVSSSPDLNRRAEIELVASSRKDPPLPCPKSWIQIIQDMPLATALIVVRGQVKESGMPPHWPAVAAIKASRMDMLVALISSAIRPNLRGEDGAVIMRAAVGNSDARFVKYLISQGLKASDVSTFGQPIAWVACNGWSSEISEAKQVEVVDVLLKWGAQPLGMVYGEQFNTPLECAARTNRLRLIKQLLAAGADPNAPVTSPPLLSGARHRDVVKTLLAAGANPSIHCKNCTSLFHDFKFENAQDVAWLAKLPIDINFSIEGGLTPLHMALRYASPQVLEAFVEHGAKLNGSSTELVNSAFSNAALAWLVDKGVTLDGVYELPQRIVNRRLDANLALAALHRRGFNLNQRDLRGNTASDLAIHLLDPDLLAQLLELGVIDTPSRGRALLGAAQGTSLKRTPSQGCVDCNFGPDWYKAEDARINAPEVIADRAQRKDKILQMLQTAITAAESK